MLASFSKSMLRATLLLLFVWAQAAVAVHDVDHNWHESSELCQALQSAEHNKALQTSSATLELIAFETTWFAQVVLSQVSPAIPAHSARSPPK